MRQCFVDAKVLYAPMFLYIFVGAYIFVYFSCAFILYAPIICWRNILRFFRLRLIIVVMIINYVYGIMIIINILS
jgi:hypothetical protein